MNANTVSIQKLLTYMQNRAKDYLAFEEYDLDFTKTIA